MRRNSKWMLRLIVCLIIFSLSTSSFALAQVGFVKKGGWYAGNYTTGIPGTITSTNAGSLFLGGMAKFRLQSGSFSPSHAAVTMYLRNYPDGREMEHTRREADLVRAPKESERFIWVSGPGKFSFERDVTCKYHIQREGFASNIQGYYWGFLSTKTSVSASEVE